MLRRAGFVIACAGTIALAGVSLAGPTGHGTVLQDTISVSTSPSTTTAAAAPTAPVTTTTTPPAPAPSAGSTPPAAAANEMAPAPTSTAAPPVSAARRAPGATVPTPSGADVDEPTPTPPPAIASTPAKHCVVRLHGKGGSGRATAVTNGVTYVSPTGNSAGWGGRQWSYSPDSNYQAARSIVAAAIENEGCGRVVINGFSNGAAFAAKLACKGETFGGRVSQVVIDDPVTDHAVDGCSPAAGVGLTLYWTGALEGQAQPGWSCASADWTCEGGSTIGIAAYSAALGTSAKQSPMGGHAQYLNPPELLRF